jgi:single-strand DNA-binding protein
MKNLRNSVSLIGRLGTDPEITTFDSGTQKAVFSLATDASYKDKEGKKVESTDWHRLVVWGGQVKVVEKYLKKGKEICIEGRLTTNTWEDKDGKKHYQAEVIVNDFLMLGGKES